MKINLFPAGYVFLFFAEKAKNKNRRFSALSASLR